MLEEFCNLRLAIHYHVPVRMVDGNLYCPFYFGIWVDSLAKRFQEIALISYTCEKCDADYQIQSSNVTIISLGNKPNSFLAHITNIPSVLRIIASSRDGFDGIGFRIPTFLAFYLYPLVRKKPVFFLLVGNMFKMLVVSPTVWWKRWILAGYWWVDLQLLMLIGNKVSVFANGEYFKQEYKSIKNINTIFTSTLLDEDIVSTVRELKDNVFRIIFVGRISPEKGLNVVLQTMSEFDIGTIFFTVVGSKEEEEFLRLRGMVSQQSLGKFVHFHGYVSNRKDLNALLDDSDVLIMPSIWEGQPRAIWEGMARGLPIIASRGIKSLPLQFKHKEEIYFVDPGNAEQIADAIKELQNDRKLYKKLSRASLRIARERTVERSVDLLVQGLKQSKKFNLT